MTRGIVANKKLRLRGEVLLHSGVEIQVLLGQVCKSSDSKVHALDSAEVSGMRRNCHDQMCHALIHHPREKLLQGWCFWSGQLCIDRGAVNACTGGANQPGGIARSEKSRLQ